MSLNSVVLMGRLTHAPELKHTQSGIPRCQFSIAVDRPFKSGEEKQVDFIDCTAWRSTAEFVAKYFGKGDMIAVDGRLQTRTWTTDDGQNRKATDVVCNTVSFCGSKRDSNGSGNSGGQGGGYTTPPPSTQTMPSTGGGDFAELTDDDGDLPF